MDIKWHNLGAVSLASFGATLAVVVLFSLGIAAWNRADGLRDGSSEDGLRGGSSGGVPARVAAGAAVLCFAACLAVAAYGIDLIVPD
ncbi:hypothetical protein ACFY0F_01385 [Streptomyces sp. NPDC001544]|uniref:hypothetical protein n=1 Tax=Streptomyces sp. NPDC001544 TaxID=3364584 RepID=UPI00368870FA